MLINLINTYTIDILALIFLFGLLTNDNLMNQNRKKSFQFVIFLTVLVMFSEIGTVIYYGNKPELRIFNIIFNILGFSITPVIPIALLTIFDKDILKRNRMILIPSILNFVFVLLSPIFKSIFYVDMNNFYHRGSFFYVFVFIYITNLLILVITTLYRCQKYFYPIKLKMLILTIFTIVGTSIQLLDPTIYSSWHCVSFSLFLYYIILFEFEVSFDTMTSLYNRAAFEKTSAKLNENSKFSLIIMDINDFKGINDTFGHEYGDSVLKAVSRVIRESFDNKCICYRIGGDELGVIYKGINSDKLEYELKKLTDNLAKECINDRCLPTVAYGYSVFNGNKTLDFKEVFMEADKQMYKCKQLQKENKDKKK